MSAPRDNVKVLFDALKRADEEVDHAEEALKTATTAQHRARSRIWEAIRATTDAQIGALSLDEEVKKLQTLVIELTARLNGGA
jgi:hypothetical protein